MSQPPLEPVDPPDARWPISEERTVFLDRETTVVDPAPPAVPPSDRGFGAGLLVGLVILALVAGGIAVAYLLTHRHNGNQATTVVITSAPVTSSPATTPSARRVPAMVVVPDVTGQPLAAAESKLRGRGLRFATTQVTSDQPVGTIVEQVPSGTRRVSKGASITLSVARAASTVPATTTTSPETIPSPATPANATVPDVSGQTEQPAVTSFNNAGVLASLVFVPSQDPLGMVEQQAKAAGTTVAYHAHVQLNLSRGPGDKQNVSVPDVTGKSLADAVTALNGARLRLIYVRFPLTSRSQAGKIVQQSPLGGGLAPENAQVLVFLGAYRP